MNLDNPDWYIKLALLQDKKLEDFLSQRPEQEDLGESLDLYRKMLVDSNQLDEETDKGIRSIHLRHQGQLLKKRNTTIHI